MNPDDFELMELDWEMTIQGYRDASRIDDHLIWEEVYQCSLEAKSYKLVIDRWLGR
jgi:hypothetical protein